MTTIELKALILQEIGDEQDSAILQKLQKYYRKLKGENKDLPCQYTLEELKARLDRAEDDVNNGRVISHEDLLSEIETW